INMGGMQLQDSGNTYTIPSGVTINAGEYKIFWADDELVDQGPLHTNFKLGASGDEIYLVNKNGILIDSKVYSEDQVTDFSYGRYPDNTEAWYTMGGSDPASEPTPGASNKTGIASKVWFSRLSGTFTGSFDLELSKESATGKIWYTVDGSEPNATNPSLTQYTGPIWVESSQARRIRARVYDSPLAPGPIQSHYYIPIDTVVENFSSNLPIVIIDSFDTDIDNNGDQGCWNFEHDDFPYPYQPVAAVFMDVDIDTGVASTTGVPDFAGRAGSRIRGESSRCWPKRQYALELWNDYDADEKHSLLGMSSESDWVLNNPYGDKTLMRNVLAYKWGNDISDEYMAPGTRFVEVFYNQSNDQTTYSDYRGVYVLTEKIKIADNRVNIARLDPTDTAEPDVTGGYILRVDKNNGQETFYTAENMVGYNPGIQYYDPDEIGLNNTQKTWIQNWLNTFETNLQSSGFDDPITGYKSYIDVESFIEYDVMNEIFKNVDGFKLSTYFYKERSGKLNFGPMWDYNFSAGNGTNDGWDFPAYFSKASSSEGWFNQTMPVYGWHSRLIDDSDYKLRTADKWFEHREDKLSDTQIETDINYYYDLLDSDGPTDTDSTPADRNFARWDILSTWVECNYYVGGTYENEINWLKTWFYGNGSAQGDYSDRMQWVDDLWRDDRNIDVPPTLEINGSSMNTGGTITAGDTLTMTGTPGTIWYTTDGKDPRVFKGTGATDITLVAESGAKKVLVPTSEVTGSGSTGSILREYWTGITGTAVSDLTNDSSYPNSPTSSNSLTTFQAPVDMGDDYGTRIRGYLHPPTTKNYTFWISGDDECQLWLSTDENPANASIIARVSEWTNSEEWYKNGEQQSSPISLTAGNTYYIEALHKEGGGGDSVAVAWDQSGSLAIIDGAYLSQEGGQVWAGESFDDSSWTTGAGGVGYENSPGDSTNYTTLIGTDVGTEMSGNNPTCYIRIPFTVTGDPAAFNVLSLNVRYDDGFIAYINGIEVLRANANAGEPTWQSAAAADRADTLAVNLTNFDITASVGVLKSGSNLLAIQGLNRTSGSSDFLISASLTGSQDTVGEVTSTAVAYSGGTTLNETTQI
ncbi:MAG: CotH kinase family protein, partial [Planctomycetota bacterium]